MLSKSNDLMERGQTPIFQKLRAGQDVSCLGAFAVGTVLTFRVRQNRQLGFTGVVLRIAADGFSPRDIPFSFVTMQEGEDVYELALDTKELSGDEDGGLFHYELLFLRGFDTRFSDSVNNVDFTLSPYSANRFRLLLYRADFRTPAWLRGATMYHVFLDRFYRGEGNASLHGDGVLDEDWENGIPDFPEKRGEPLANNRFFGGNLWGVVQKLDYLQSLGVTVLYLSPIFEAASNHRYDTANYEVVDSLLGGQEAFDTLIREAHGRGIRVILDGVFNHTGDRSVYFNRTGEYQTVGAAQSKQSPFFGWYSFRSYPDEYECWWGIPILPKLRQDNPDCRDYFTGKDGIASRWILRGADGWRLDVADELPNEFLDEFRETVKEASNGDGLIIGEVWENAADKIAYGSRRRYLTGKQLDSVMNYPFRNAILALLLYRDVESFYNILTDLYASYPPEVSHSLMNLLGTHDTERILTVLGSSEEDLDRSNQELSTAHLSDSARAEAKRLLKIASLLQFTVFGVPSVYYGDEAGMEGYHDPFCRFPYPWGREDRDLLDHYRALGKLRAEHPALKEGSFRFLSRDASSFVFERACKEEKLLVAVNLGSTPIERFQTTVPPMTGVVIKG